MNVNIVNRTNITNFCRYKLFSRSYLLNEQIAHKKLSSPCLCSSISSCSGTITSNKWVVEKCSQNNLIQIRKRWYNTESGPPSNKLPPLMHFPRIVWPSLIKSIRNFILATFIIKPYLDREFSLSDFVAGSKKAVEVVSNKLSDGDIKTLDGLVTEDIMSSLQKNVSVMSLSQREQLAVNADDIYFSFPYQIGIMFDDEDKDQKRFVEITMVYHSLKGLSSMRSRGEEPPLNMGMLPEYQTRISICNYRFIREFTKGVDNDWTVNLLNHFKPSDEEK